MGQGKNIGENVLHQDAGVVLWVLMLKNGTNSSKQKRREAIVLTGKFIDIGQFCNFVKGNAII